MTSFTVTWDYRCPFARNAHEHILDALAAGADWEVTFAPFSLGQVHVEEGQPDVWDRPEEDSGLLALQAGVVVRDSFPEEFHEVHRNLFALRHDQGRNLREQAEIARVLDDAGVDSDAVFEQVSSGKILEVVKEEHTRAADENEVWGVPTFIMDGSAAFVRLMDRPQGDGDHARKSIQRVLDLFTDAPQLNEFKHTSLSR